MNAASVAEALGDASRTGRDWRCRCPVHGGRSLTLRDGDGGRLLVTCWGGCDRLDVLAELRIRGLLGGERDHAPSTISASRRRCDYRNDDEASVSHAHAASGGKRVTHAEARSPAISPAAR